MDTSSDGGTDSLQECDERPRIVRDELPAVTRGSFPSLDYVHCPVPGCKFSTGKGLLRNSLANHWAAAGNVETHSCYELVVPDINKGKRKSAEQARNQKAKQRALMHTFFLPSAAQAAAAAAAVPAPAVVAGNAACQPSGVGAQPVTGAVADTGAGAGAAAPVDSAGETSLPSLSGSPRASESDEDAPEDGSDEYAGVDADATGTGTNEAATPGSGLQLRVVSGHFSRLSTAVGTLAGSQAGLPGRVAVEVVNVLQRMEAAKQEAALAARVKGQTFEEIAASTGLVIRDGHLVCECCAASNFGRARGQGGHPGMWSTSRRLCEVKADVEKHLQAASHVQAKQAAHNAEQEKKKARHVAINVMRAVYFLLKEADPHTKYERLLVLLDRSRVNIGTLNHGRELVAALLPSFERVFMKRLGGFLAGPVAATGGRNPVLAWSADKLTVKRVKQEVRCALYVNGAAGEVKAVMVCCEPVKSGADDREALAKAQLATLASVGIPKEEVAQRVAGFVFDGAYIQGLTGIGDVLKKTIGMTGGGFMTCTWDLAHLLERGAGDVLEDKHGIVALQSVDWIIKIADSISAINNMFMYGAGNQEAKDLANEVAATFRDPIKMCDSRFLQYNVRAITAYLDSFKVMASWYERAATIPVGATTGRGQSMKKRTARNAEEARFHELHCKMCDGAFVGRLLMLRQVLSWVVELSLAAQKVNTWPPELREMELALLARLKRMADDLCRKDTDSRPQVLRESDWPQLYVRTTPEGPTLWGEFTEGRFQGVQLLMPHLYDDRDERQYTPEELPGLFKDEAGDLVAALHHFLDLRLVQGKQAPRQGEKAGAAAIVPGHVEANNIIEAAGRALDFRKLCVEPCQLTNRASALEFLLREAATSGVIIAPTGERPSIADQLELLRTRLVAAAAEEIYANKWFPWQNDGTRGVASCVVFLADIWTTPAFYEGIEDLMYLINHLWLKSKCEAVVEGMGGIVSLHGDKSRGRLRQELTEIEALVHYNFPPLASRACEVLIEEVLNHYFTGPDGKQRPWHFEHATADQGRRALFARRSKVMRRHDEAEVKHAFLGCDV